MNREICGGYNAVQLFFLAILLSPLLQIGLGNLLNWFYGVEMWYLVMETKIPTLLSVLAYLITCFRRDFLDLNLEVLSFVILTTLLLNNFLTVSLYYSEGLYEKREWKAFSGVPVNQVNTVKYDDVEFSFNSSKALSGGGYIIKRTSKSGWFARYSACPKKKDNDECFNLFAI